MAEKSTVDRVKEWAFTWVPIGLSVAALAGVIYFAYSHVNSREKKPAIDEE